MSPNKLLIASRIKQIRIESGLTQEELGKKLSLNKSTIQRYEKGIIDTIKKPIIEAIANSLNVNPDWLLGTSEEKQLANISSNLSFLQKYNKLNTIGKDRANEYIDGLLLNEMYTKEDKKTVIDFDKSHTSPTTPSTKPKDVRYVGKKDGTVKTAAYGGGVKTNKKKIKHT